MTSLVARVLVAIVAPVRRLFRLEAAGGLVLVLTAALALFSANSPWSVEYQHLVELPIRVGLGASAGSISVHALVNDGLMTIFFAVVGMEIKREIATGQLRSVRRAALPLIAAAGGMLVPALVYLAFNGREPTRNGWAIPTATDIAFALGCASMVKRRVPWSLFVFLMALAIFDDIGAILIIAVAYGSATHLTSLAVAALITAGLFALGRARVYKPWLYLLLGGALWLAVARSGLHPTIAGVILGFAIPTSSGRSLKDALEDLDVAVERIRSLPPACAEGSLAALETHARTLQTPVERLLSQLHGLVAFGVVPLFALVNAGIVLNGESSLVGPVTAGVALALVVGKPLGVLGGVYIATRTKLTPLPTGTRWKHVLGIALFAGIGFTMSFFITGLAFPSDGGTAMSAKVGILAGSVASALLGLAVLRFACAELPEGADDDDALTRVDLPRFDEDFRVASWTTTPSLSGQSLSDAALRRDRGITVLGVFRDLEEQTAAGARYRKLSAVDPDHVLTAGETFLIVGERHVVDQFMAENV